MVSPFDNITDLQRHKLLNLLQVHIYKYQKAQEILPTIKSENIIGIILTGKAEMLNIDYNGNQILLERLEQNSVFGTNINPINQYNCEIIAKEYTEVLVINYNSLFNEDNIKHFYFNIFVMNLFDIINTKFKETNEKMRVLEQKTIRDKLLEYFEIQYKKSSSKTIELPFHLKDFADYMAVNRSAMFRELKYMKEEKFISINGKKITLLYKTNKFV